MGPMQPMGSGLDFGAIRLRLRTGQEQSRIPQAGFLRYSQAIK